MSLAGLLPTIEGTTLATNYAAIWANAFTITTFVFGIILVVASIATTTLDANTRRKRSLHGGNFSSEDPGGSLNWAGGGVDWAGSVDWVGVLLSASTFMDTFDCGERLVCEVSAMSGGDAPWVKMFRHPSLHASVQPRIKSYHRAYKVAKSKSCAKVYPKCPAYTTLISSFLRSLF